ncbi:GNAT family N-acetyltransferase [Rhizobium sp. SL42]|uniref:GNAT family N-acetyltransferase n=1 Tax=Rhizobium sp. SL42 TaxID=2806346 RepID=UPI001F20DA10|nr:GNAT family N-acetyltransferase [Rhizobium sp. SL42]UJW76731.1 GNAT family N-acetyltransferase [Rhizobium sp. SL42]
MEIRRIGETGYSDYGALLELIVRSFAYMDGVIDPPSSAHRLNLDGLTQKAVDEIGLAAFAEDKLVGCVFVKPEARALYIGKLAVAPDMQGHGIGYRLLTEAETIARHLGRDMLRLETRVELTGNHQRFSAWGFVKTTENCHPGFTRTTSIEMCKRLA